MEKTITNSKFSASHIPKVSVITSVYNRRDLLLRAMESVAAQTFKDIEYIVVNNGSTIDIDDVVEGFMKSADIPVVYIKRDNGIGPHTGKNSAIKAARGTYLVMLDSDDELLPDCVEKLYNTWMSIPSVVRRQYREVVAQCIDEYGNRVGSEFPESLNFRSPKEAFKSWQGSDLASEHVSMDRTQCLKEYPFPEPEGVSWVVDSVVLWNRLSKKYRSYFINDLLKRYYVGSPDSISNQEIRKTTPQHLRNLLWAHMFELNHWDEYYYTFRDRLDCTLKVVLYKKVLKSMGELPDYPWTTEKVNGFFNKTLMLLWSIPCHLGATQIFKKLKM